MANSPVVLIVDDAPIMRDIVELQLKALGIDRIHTAGSGEEACRLMQYRRFDLILSDWSMSGMSGLDLLVKTRQDERLKETPFILITGEMQRQMIHQAVSAGVNDFLLKPFKPQEFSRKIQAALSGRSQVAPPTTSVPFAAQEAPAPATKATILLVDDTPDNLTLASRLLSDNYRIKMAASGEKALQLCKASPPDLILLDIMMPEIDGFEVCRRLKANADTAQIPVIFLTALDDVAKTVEGFDLGAVDYVGKPFEPAILKARVATALRLSRAHEELREHYDLAIENARLREEVERIARHDLKNPLAAIIGMASTLLGQDNFTDEQEKQIKSIERSSYDMLDLIQCSNELFKMERGEYELEREPVDLDALVQRVAEESRMAFAGKEVSIQVVGLQPPGEALSVVQGNQVLLYSMLNNLVKNAAEAVKPGETVRIELDRGNGRRIRIKNPGVVPEEIRDRFFNKFVTSGKSGGTGVGTYSAKLITEAHGGSIAMKTSDEDGTVITVELPLSS